jgi:hypothetical protein
VIVSSGALGRRSVTVRTLKNSAVDLHFGGGADADARAERSEARDIASETVDEIGLLRIERESSLEEDMSRADRFRILRDERPLLRVRRSRSAVTHATKIWISDSRFQISD